MSENSAIEWTDATWNPTRGCTEIAPGCAHCYAKTFAERFRGVKDHPYEQGFDPRIVPEQLPIPLRWKRPRKIFVDSMSDLFHESFPFDFIAAVFGIMAAAADRDLGHTFIVLTKRPSRAIEFFEWLHAESDHIKTILHEAVKAYMGYDHPERPAVNVLRGWPLPNVWFGTSIANQTDADKNIPLLLKIPAAVRFVSAEPLIGPVDLFWYVQPLNEYWTEPPMLPLRCQWVDGCDGTPKRLRIDPYIGYDDPNYRGWLPVCDAHTGIHWIIVGGESGHSSRPCNVEWIRSIVEQCKAADVACFVKQLGAKPLIDVRDDRTISGWRKRALEDPKGGDMEEWPTDLQIREFPEAVNGR